jgi:hypothetical protein
VKQRGNGPARETAIEGDGDRYGHGRALHERGVVVRVVAPGFDRMTDDRLRRTAYRLRLENTPVA